MGKRASRPPAYEERFWLDSSLDTEGVVESEAFEWLVRGLLRQSCYRLDEKQLRPVVSQRIVDEIPTSTMISSQDAPKSYKVIFQLPWDTLRTDLQLESVIFTSSSDFEIQATTVEDYLDQTWGHRGRDILSVVESVLKHRTGKDASPDTAGIFCIERKGEKICAMLGTGQISVTGPACYIAERADQVAWLVAALQHSPPSQDLTIHSKVVVEKQTPAEGEEFWLFRNVNDTKSTEPTLSFLPEWLGQGVDLVIARGFPTARRPEFCPGIEVSGSTRLQLFRRYARLITDPHQVGGKVNGPAGIMRLVKRVGHVFIWHLFGRRPEYSGE
ncbi:hypothetical protein N656DRAFT_613964 [Canariomyces notabilis]|uniref:Uncharacterized protein n=1 Tax=Canariomyces notabilis TaxID=2074819 RepID=A0AAN6TF74_9PEZI|nr:hypothetical protein N656DRAFT_613964 [Canariomyces arenarius]